MALFGKDLDAAFQGAGAKSGLDIWCIENLHLVPVPKSSYGKFFSGSAYLVLHTVFLKSGTSQHDIHYWLGSNANQADSTLVSDKALELDAALGSYTVQYREVQGQETEKFLSYFKPCIIPMEGVFSLAPGNVDSEAYPITLLTCKGDRVVHVKEVPFNRTSLNHNDVFILDTASKIFIFCGCNSSIQERAKALEVVQYIRENKHQGNCDIATIDDGKFVGDADVGEFWSLFGGYAPIPRDLTSDMHEIPETSTVKLFWITYQGKLCESGIGVVRKETLESNKCYMLDCDAELFVWMGRNTSVTERKVSIKAVEDFLRSEGRSSSTHLTFLTEGSETASFTSYFCNWPQFVELKLYEEGREKVAAMFKQHGYDVQELPNDAEDDHLFLDLSGVLKVWGVDGDNGTLIPVSEKTKLYSGESYVVQYTYINNAREENLFYTWIGRESVMEDRADAISHMIALVNATKGNPAMAQIVEGNEPDSFLLIFKILIIFKGGKTSRYKRSIMEKGVVDDTFDDTKTALFRVQGTSPYNMQAIQVDLVATSLNSSCCYILKTERCTFIWIGNLSSSRDHDLVDRMLELINPTWQPIMVREGSESDVFWSALGGKVEYSKEKEIKGYVDNPQLFVCTSSEENLKVKEIYNFSQDDLTTEDVLILDCHREIYVWIGRNSHVDKKRALDFGLMFLEKETPGGVHSQKTPLYIVNEGCEPTFFTRFFDWDFSKANMLGNSFEKKLAILKGKQQKLEAPLRSSWKSFSLETNPANSRSRSVGTNGSARSLSPSNTVSRSPSRYLDSRRFSSPAPLPRKLFTESFPSSDNDGSIANSNMTPGAVDTQLLNHSEADANLPMYPYERLTVVSKDPIGDIDVTKREAYLSEEEFHDKFRMAKRSFYELPKWKQNKLKRSLHLF